MNQESIEFKNKIVSVLDSNTLDEAAVLINGEYLTTVSDGKRRLVYVSTKISHDGIRDLVFYTKLKDTNSNTYNLKNVAHSMMATIETRLLSPKLYGYTVPGFASLTKCPIRSCAENGFLILESQLYASVRTIVESGKSNQSFKFGGDVIEPTMIRKLVELFKRESYSVYRKLLFSPFSRKLMNKLRTRGKFLYGIQGSFVPVFIDYKKVHNPFKYSDTVKNTRLYKQAVEKGRVREFANVSCYYLTQYEVCKALGMTQFMRFTPVFLYDVFAGLLFPNNDNFPAATRMVYVSDGGNGTSFFSIETYQKVIASVMSAMELSPDDKHKAESRLLQLQRYEKQSSLLFACRRNLKSLVDVGGQGLDDDREHTKTAIAYFNYLKQAKLLFD